MRVGIVIAREARMVEHKALLDTREQDVSSREEKLDATRCAKDDDLESLMQHCTKELEDKHKAAWMPLLLILPPS